MNLRIIFDKLRSFFSWSKARPARKVTGLITYEKLESFIGDFKQLTEKRQNALIGHWLAKEGWVFSFENLAEGRKILAGCRQRYNSDLNKYLEKVYKRNNYQVLWQQLDDLITNSESDKKYSSITDYHDALILINKYLKEDKTAGQVILPALFGMVEYALVVKLGFLHIRKYGIRDKCEEYRERIKKQVFDPNDTRKLEIYCVLTCFSHWWDTRYQQFVANKNKIGVGRHTVMHGRVNPHRFTLIEVAKIISLLHAIVNLPTFELYFQEEL